MSKKSVVTLWIIAVLLGTGVALLKYRKHDTGEAKTQRSRGQTLLESFPAADVAKLQIKGFEESVTLVKKDNSWVVAERADYPANVSTVNALLRTVEEVKINNSIEAGPSYGKRFGIDLTATTKAGHGTELTFLNAKNENIKTLFLGKESEGGGRFIQNSADTSGIYVTSESFPTATADPKAWLDDSFLKVEKIKSISVSAAGKPDQLDWKLTRVNETAEFTLEGAKDSEKLDAAATSPMKSLLSMARFQDVGPTAEVATLEKAADRRVATIETVDGFTYVITLAPKAKTDKPDAAKPEDGPPPQEDSYNMAVKVTATLAKERTKAADEKPEDAKSKDEEFQTKIKALEAKLKTEQAFQSNVFEVSKYTIDSLLKSRAELLSKPADNAGPQAPPPGLTPLPSGSVEAVTPPISIEQ